MRFWACLLLLPALAAAGSAPLSPQDAPLSRQKRFSAQGCTMSDGEDKENPVEERQSVTLSCNFDATVETCVWLHDEPLNVGNNAAGNFDVKCSGSSSDNGQTCDADSRITYDFSGNMCGITIMTTEPEDTGKWRLNAAGLSTSGSLQPANREFELYTFNQTTVVITDQDMNEIRTVETSYNYNDRQNRWVKGFSNWESVEVYCQAAGGRPPPEVIWYIENDDNNDLEQNEHFDVSTNVVSNDDEDGYIQNYESSLRFGIDDKFMEILEEAGVDTNPQDEEVRFQLTCETEQFGSQFVQRDYIDVIITKKYDNGALASDTIGIIVGVVVAVLLIVIVAAIVIFARASGKLCFSESDYDYNDPRNQKKQPRTAGGGGGGGRRDRSHSREGGYKDQQRRQDRR